MRIACSKRRFVLAAILLVRLCGKTLKNLKIRVARTRYTPFYTRTAHLSHLMHVLPRKNMFSCAISQFATLRKLLRHIRLSHSDQENFRIACNLQGCSRTFQSLRTFETPESEESEQMKGLHINDNNMRHQCNR